MADHEDELTKVLGELNQKLERLQLKKAAPFSQETISEFGMGFFDLIIGLLAYLQKNTATHRRIECETQCDQLHNVVILDENGYENFSHELANITPPASVNFTFRLKDSYYPIGDISEKFTVYFQPNGYEILFELEGDQKLRLAKAYMKHIEPDEIRQLRDRIIISLTKKTSNKIESL